MTTTIDGAFGLVVRFKVKQGKEQDFDDLTAATVREVQRLEPGTLLYVCHVVETEPTQRIFYELYENRSAFDTHEAQPHVQRFLAERTALLDDLAVDFVSPTFYARRAQ